MFKSNVPFVACGQQFSGTRAVHGLAGRPAVMRIRRTAALALAVSALLSGTALADSERIVLRGARILTMDEVKPEAEAIALVDGRIAAVGTPEDVAPFLKGAKVYDLPAGALVLPGFQDSHTHLLSSGTAEITDIDLSKVVDEKSLRAAIGSALADLPAGAWLRGNGWSTYTFKEPSAKILDEIVGDRPVYFSDQNGHTAWVSSAALKAAGIDAKAKDPEGGRIERDADGNPTGLLRDEAMALVGDVMPAYSEDKVDVGLAKAQAAALSHGITAIIDAWTSEWELTGYQRADDAGKLKLRVAAAVGVESRGLAGMMSKAANASASVAKVLDLQKRFAGPHLKVTSVKLMADGSFSGNTAALLQPYVGSNQYGVLSFTQQQLNELVIAVDKAGLQVHTHANGDAAIRMALNAYEAAQKANGKRDSRHIIAHVRLVDPADIPRFGKLGVIADVNPLFVRSGRRNTEKKIGPQRLEWLYPYGALHQADATVVGSSDWNVASMNPLEAIQTGVTRKDIADPNSEVLTPQHRLDVMDMLKAYTVDGAFAAFDEKESGTLTKGKRADVVVLDKDITKVPSSEIATAKVLATFASGESVYEADRLPRPATR
ncbi:amidohydrolase [Rhizobium lentis]|uniref:amidohydrolase n=1 Tax=Rhizobium lentis TaxID=1138194 RepID=UPI001C82E392|nr:amidohydrolase [Rhizobium lentis]MBX5141277.1 amidohydrolase [Rhizobium lentis]